MTVRLQSGPCWAEFDPRTGAVGRFGVGSVELLHGVYAAVRDADWGTADPCVRWLSLRELGDGIEVAFRARCRGVGVDVAWRGELTLRREGTLCFEFDAEAIGDSRVNRAGLCVLHPAACAGLACRVERGDGHTQEASFPERIAPHPLFTDLSALTYTHPSGLTCAVRMSGEAFETEDQRNWTDLSFKTYCTPLSRPFPRPMRAGERVRQRVEVRVGNIPPTWGHGRKQAGPDLSRVHLSDQPPEDTPHRVRPALGCVVTPGGPAPLEWGTARSGDAGLDHTRVEFTVRPGLPTAAEGFRRAFRAASCWSPNVELALTVADDATEDGIRATARLLEEAARQAGVTPQRLIALGTGGRPVSPPMLARLRCAFPELLLYAGTDANFTELNRERPDARLVDGVAFAANPQTHAFDDRSIAETPAGLACCIRDARAIAEGNPVAVSPLTLRPRVNAAATSPETPPPPADPRQAEPFAAAWFVAAYAHAAAAGAASVTLGPATGPYGLGGADGEPYPIGRAVEAVISGGADQAWRAPGSVTAAAEGLVLENGGRRRWLIALFDDVACHAPSGAGRWLAGGGDAELAATGWRLRADAPAVFQIDTEKQG